MNIGREASVTCDATTRGGENAGGGSSILGKTLRTQKRGVAD